VLKKIILTIITFTLLATLGSISPVFAAFQNFAIVPPEFEFENDFGSQSTFDCADLPSGSRLQVRFPAEDLHGGLITGISLRLFDGSPGFGPVVGPPVTFIMSTYVNPPPLSTTFAENTGPDAVTVFAGDLIFGTVPGCNTNPCPFDLPVIFQTPFPYTPNFGDLLLDIIVPPCVGGIPPNVLIDSTFVLDAIFAADSNDDEGDNGFGNISEIVLALPAPIPTLSEWGLIAMAGILGLVGFMVIRRRKAVA